MARTKMHGMRAGQKRVVGPPKIGVKLLICVIDRPVEDGFVVRRWQEIGPICNTYEDNSLNNTE